MNLAKADRQLRSIAAASLFFGLLASAILLDDGKMFGRVVHPDGNFEPLERVSIVGDDISFYEIDK